MHLLTSTSAVRLVYHIHGDEQVNIILLGIIDTEVLL